MSLKKFYDAANVAEARVQQIAAQINDLFEAGKTDEALAMRPQLDAAKKNAQDAHQLYLSMQAATSGNGDPAQRFIPAVKDPESESKQNLDLRASAAYRDAFFKAFKNGVSPKTISAGFHGAEPYRSLLDALSETGGSPAGSEGGFLLPVDFDAKIHEKQRLAVDLEPLVNVEPVTSYSGWRTVETSKASSAFSEINEADYPSSERISAMESPTFTKVEYALKKYGGYLPIANDLLNDTPANIMEYLARWCGRKTSLTNTSLVLAIMNAISATNVTDYKKVFTAMKTALNKTLDPAISANAIVVCNQTGFDLLDQMDDGTGRPLLQPDPTDETVKRFKGRQIVVVSDAQQVNLSVNTITPILIGDASELLTMFKRSAGEMAVTTIGGSAWRNDNTEIRYIFRKRAVQVDSAAMVRLTVTLPA